MTWFHGPWVRLKLPRNQLRMPGFQPTSCQPLSEKKSHDQYFPRLHCATRGAHTLGTSMLCLWGCGSRGCISLSGLSLKMAEIATIKNQISNTLSRAACTTASLSVSRAEVASSRRRIVGFRTRARAIAIRCF